MYSFSLNNSLSHVLLLLLLSLQQRLLEELPHQVGWNAAIGVPKVKRVRVISMLQKQI